MWSDITPFTAANSGRSTVSDRRIFVFNDHLDQLTLFYTRIDFRCLGNCICNIWNELNALATSEMRDIKQCRINFDSDTDSQLPVRKTTMVRIF